MARAGDQHSSSWVWDRLPALPLLDDGSRLMPEETTSYAEMFWHGLGCACPDCDDRSKKELSQQRMEMKLAPTRATQPAPPLPHR